MSPSHDALQLMWLASPALPIGAFSYSEGLEAAIDHGHVSDAASAAPNDAPSSFHERSISCIATPRPCASARAPIPRGEQ